MRINQIITENEYNDDLRADTEDLIASAMANGSKKISLQKLAARLNGMGYEVNAEALTPLLDASPLVQDVSGYIVILSNDVEPSEPSSAINKMATKSSMSSIKK